MTQWTYGQAAEKVLRDLDLTDEDFVAPDELVDYFNEAIREAEAEIHKLGVEDEYFLKKYAVPLVANTDTYALPTDIYINKIRGVVYQATQQIYNVKRLRRMNKFARIADIAQNGQADDYQYYLVNSSSATNQQMVLVPTSRETSNTNMAMWYVRNANLIPYGELPNTSTVVIDIPEFISFILQYVKVRILQKDMNPLLDQNIQILQQQRKLMVDTLTNQVDDDDTLVEPDFTMYFDMS